MEAVQHQQNGNEHHRVPELVLVLRCHQCQSRDRCGADQLVEHSKQLLQLHQPPKVDHECPVQNRRVQLAASEVANTLHRPQRLLHRHHAGASTALAPWRQRQLRPHRSGAMVLRRRRLASDLYGAMPPLGLVLEERHTGQHRARACAVRGPVAARMRAASAALAIWPIAAKLAHLLGQCTDLVQHRRHGGPRNPCHTIGISAIGERAANHAKVRLQARQ
mmetsp:Transcript_68540/g.198887  ORF Transcript_68540/g.198887 Transcript_68540/m.198887 type:complete len:220 (+) Transcript_68540:1065-1724(+)